METVGQGWGAELVLRAEHLLVERGRILEGGGLRLRGGRVVEVLGDSRSVHRAAERCGVAPVDTGAPWVLPGWVNAHAHLELHDFAGRLPRDQGFGAWVGTLLGLRDAASLEALGSAALRGSEELLGGGTTCVADVDTRGGGRRGLGCAGIRAVLQREVLDARDPRRTPGAIEALDEGMDPSSGEGQGLVSEGLSAHAPFSVSEDLMAAVAERAGPRDLQVSCHWSETPEELAYLVRGEGPLAAVLGPSPRTRGLDLLERAGLLGPRTTLIHGNHPEVDEPERIAAAGSCLVHCPGTHAFFDREPFPFGRYRRAGVTLALGTDSRASNDGFDLRRELVLFDAQFPGLSPWDLMDLTTVSAAKAVGLPGRVGTLAPGAWGDWMLFDPAGASGSSAIEALVAGEGRVLGSWVGGVPRGPSHSPG